jgi:hypothetical protein
MDDSGIRFQVRLADLKLAAHALALPLKGIAKIAHVSIRSMWRRFIRLRAERPEANAR